MLVKGCVLPDGTALEPEAFRSHYHLILNDAMTGTGRVHSYTITYDLERDLMLLEVNGQPDSLCSASGYARLT